MDVSLFEIRLHNSRDWQPVPHVNEAQMREIDRIAMEEFRLGILQMMENAGRNLAIQTIRLLEHKPLAGRPGKVMVAAGVGGNGGGGLCAARHLHNRGVEIILALTKPAREFTGAAQVQLSILNSAGVMPVEIEDAGDEIAGVDVILDAMIGYSLRGAPRGTALELIDRINETGLPVISLDLPSGLEASTGETPGGCVKASQTLSLALPKPGLVNPLCGELFLADIGIPPEVYLPLGIRLAPSFDRQFILDMRRTGIKL